MKTYVDDLKQELEDWKDNIPENLQDGEKAGEIESAIDELENLSSALEDLDFGSVEFPSAM